jgi:hypothetical protein
MGEGMADMPPATAFVYDCNPEVFDGRASEAFGWGDSRGVGAMEDSVRDVRECTIGVGRGRSAVEGGFGGEADHGALPAVRCFPRFDFGIRAGADASVSDERML